MGASLVINIQKHEKRVRILSLLLQVWLTSKVEFLVKASKFNKRSTRDALVTDEKKLIMIKHENDKFMNLTNMKNYGCENAKILSSSINLCLFRFNHIWIPNTDVKALLQDVLEALVQCFESI